MIDLYNIAKLFLGCKLGEDCTMAWHNKLGEYGEEKVNRYLLDMGYTVLERNWQTDSSNRRNITTKIPVMHSMSTTFIRQFSEELPTAEAFLRGKQLWTMVLPAIQFEMPSMRVLSSNSFAKRMVL